MRQQELNETLVLFCEIGRLETVKTLIEMGADPAFNREAAMRYASLYNRLDVMHYLLSLKSCQKGSSLRVSS